MADPQDPNAQAFTEAQEAHLKNLVGGIVNSAMRGHLIMADKKRAEDREAVRQDFSKLLDEKFSALTDGGGGGKKGKDDPHLATLQKDLQTLREQHQLSEKARLEERAQRRRIEMRAKVSESFKRAGGDPLKDDLFQAYAVDSKRLIHHVDDDSDDVVGEDATAGAIELDSWVKSFLKTDTGKHFVPPTGAGGSGARKPPPQSAGGEQKKLTYGDIGNLITAQSGSVFGSPGGAEGTE